MKKQLSLGDAMMKRYKKLGIAGIRKLGLKNKSRAVTLKDLVGLIRLPDGQDSLSYIRNVRTKRKASKC